MMQQEDTKKLIGFVYNVREDIDGVVSCAVDINPKVESFYSLIKNAWADMYPRFEEIAEYLSGKKHLEKMEEQLEDRGLAGIQLELKLRAYQQHRNEFKEVWDDFEKASENERNEKRGKLGDILFKLLRTIGGIFEGLGFIPGTDALNRLKGALEEVIP